MAELRELLNERGWRVTVDSAPLPDGRVKEELRIHRADSVQVIAIPSPGRILLIREYRPFLGQYVWMLPSGKADKPEDVDLALAAQRELREETGFRADHLEHFHTCFYSESFVFKNHIYIGRDLVKDPLPQDDSELIEVHEMALEEAMDIINAQTPTHVLSGYALLKFAQSLHK